MKRIYAGLFLLAATAGLIFAQGEKRREPGTAPEKTSVNGTLGIAKGSISLKSGSDTYYVMGLDRFVGFIDGLKEGASVSLEGYAFTVPQNDEGKVFRVTKLTLNGKDYDLDFRGFAAGENSNSPQGWGSGSRHAPGQNRDGRQLPQGNKPGGRR